MTHKPNPETVAPYGLWQSPFDIKRLFSQPSIPSYPFRKNGVLYWLEALPEDRGRVVLMCQREAERICLLPPPFSIRTRVHEYGGCCFCVVDHHIVFNNFSDGHLYLLTLREDATPIRLTAHPDENSLYGYADLTPSPNHDLIVAVSEESAPGGSQNFLAVIPLDLTAPRETAPQRIAHGKDFYCCPAFSDDGGSLAWIEWDHPFMPWDQSRLCRAEFDLTDNVATLSHRETVVDQPGRTICQPGFLPDRSLLFTSDSDSCDFWNLFRHQNGTDFRVTHREAELGEAHWVFGQKRWRHVGGDIVIAVETAPTGDRIVEVDLTHGEVTVLHRGFAVCNHLSYQDGELLFVARYADRDAEILSLKVADGALRCVWKTASGVESGVVSMPQPIGHPTRDGERAFGYFYPPANPGYTAPEDSKPPLMVLVHGGPTGRTTSEFSPLKQYFASLGYALLDVNHRGSTGHGRKYRQQLLGKWGEIDTTDIIDGIEYVISQGWANRHQVFIRGSSAGGYAVLRALTRYADYFAAGACYYGIGNLITLAEMTHKFEGKYTDRLIGETYDPDRASSAESRYTRRSPIFEMDKLACPLILFQGLEDKVVPPEVSREVVDILEEKALKYDYVEYAGEGHGFRMAETRIDSLNREVRFFSEVIRNTQKETGS